MSAWSDAVAAVGTPYLWWKGDEASGTTATDSSGNGLTGTYSTPITLNQAGMIGGDPASKSFTITGTNGNLAKVSGMSYPNIGVTYVQTFKSSVDISAGRFFAAGGTTYLSLGASSFTANISTGVAPVLAYDPSTLCDGNPHLIIYIVRSTTVELWVDGTMVASASHAGVSSTMTAFQIKQSFGSPIGSWDDILIYNTAISSSQVTTLYFGWTGTPSVYANLTGSGTFSATAVRVATTTAALTGSGAFNATTAAVVPVTADLTGGGDFTAVATEEGVVQVDADLVGAGDFTATVTSSERAPAYLLILTPQVEQPSSSLTAVMANLDPLVEVTFAIDGVAVGTEFADANGDILEIVLPVDRQFGAGIHELTGTTATQEAAAPFEVMLDPNALPTTPAPDEPPVLVEPPVNNVYRWVFQDAMPGGLGSWVMPVNPTTMSNPHVRKTLAQASTTAVRGRFHVSQGATPVDWEFAGFAPDQAFQDKLLAYAELPYRFYIIDHRGRAWTVAIVSLDIKPRNRVLDDQGQPQDWLADYAVKVALFSQVPAVPVVPVLP